MSSLGVDGCRAGWYAVSRAMDGQLEGRVFPTMHDLLQHAPGDGPIAVDIPIGLTTATSRPCDLGSRRFLAPRRSSSVFPAPYRAVLAAHSHPEASEIRRGIDGKGVSIQAFAITAKIQEIDTVLLDTPRWQERVYEVHPEVSFAALNGNTPLKNSKKRSAGRTERLELLTRHFGAAPEDLVRKRTRKSVAADDVLDAIVALWSAERIATGRACSIPLVPDHDERGLRMAIHY